MSMTAANFLIQVKTWIPESLASLRNLNCAIATFNRSINNPADYPANLGDTVNIQLPPRLYSNRGLVASFNQGIVQLLHPITVDQASNVPYAHNAQQFLFNLDKSNYLEKVAKPALAVIGNDVEIDLMSMANSSSKVMLLDENGQSYWNGQYHTESGPFRCFGNGNTAINSFTQLAQIIADFKNFGCPPGKIKVYLPDTYIPAIVGTGLSQFTPKRGDESSKTWEIGTFGGMNVEYYSSNNMPTHIAGDVGQTGATLTVISTTTDATGAVVGITFSGATASMAKSLRAGDILTFKDSVSGFKNMRFMQYTGSNVTQQPVQVRVQNDVDADGSGHVDVAITPGLMVGNSQTSAQKINQAILPGMQVTSTNSHVCGMIVSGDAAYFASPALPEVTPYPCSTDREDGLSIRVYYGNVPFKNICGYVHDVIWASTGIPQYLGRIAFPLITR